MKKLRIAMISERFVGSGAAQAATELAESLLANGHTVEYFTAEEIDPDINPDMPVHQFSSWQSMYQLLSQASSYQLTPARRDRAVTQYHTARKENLTALSTALKNYAPDIVHYHNVSAVLAHSAVNAIAEEYPTFWTLHDRFVFDMFHNEWTVDGQTEHSWDRHIGYTPSYFGRTILAASPNQLNFIAPSRWLLELLVSSPLGDRHNAVQLANIVNTALPAGLLERTDLLKRLDLDKLALAVIPRTTYSLKGFDFLREGFLHARALIAAQPEYEAIRFGLLVTTNEDLGLNGVGIYTLHDLRGIGVPGIENYLNQGVMRDLYRLCDVTVIPSRAENLPNVAVESIRDGCPLIGTRVGGIPEIIEEWGVGELVNQDDRPALARAFLEVCLYRKKSDYAPSLEKCWTANYEPGMLISKITDLYYRSLETPGNCSRDH